LKEILKWQKLQGREILKQRIRDKNLFEDEEDVMAYHFSDSRSSRDVEKASGVKYKTVQSLWKKWLAAGIAEPADKYCGGRCKRIFDLSELGLELPTK
jgi:transposase